MRVYERLGRWYVDFSYNGKRYRRSAGRSKREALLKLGEIQRRIEQEASNNIPASAPRKFWEYAEEYLGYSKSNKASSSHRRDKTSMSHLAKAFGEMELHSLQVTQIEQYKRFRQEKVSPSLVNRELALLKHMLHKAVDWEYLKSNPAQTVKMLKEPPERLRYLQPEERYSLLKECSGILYAIVTTALETGMRKSEILNLTWKDVDLARRTITVTRTKNGEIRTLPISDTLQLVLERLYLERRGSWVFAKEDGMSYGNWRKAFENACKRAGIEDFRFHDLRHTFASYLVMAGVDIRTVQELMGHKDIKMTMRYSHLSKAHLLEAVNKVGTKLAQIGFDPLENLTSDVDAIRRRSSVGRAAES